MSDGRHGKGEAMSIIAGLKARLERVTADRDRLAEHLAERERLDQVTFAAAGDQTGPLPVVPGQRQPAHRTPREARWLKAVPVVLALAGGLRVALRWAFHHAVPAVAVTGGGGLVIVTAALVTTSPAHSTPPAVSSAAAPAGIDWTATPISSPSAAARAAVRPGLDVRSSRKRTVIVLPPVPAPTVSVQAAPPSPSPVPYSPPAAAPAPPLTLNTTEIDLGVYLASQPGALTISDTGDAVAWSATCSPDVSLQPGQGYLAAGQQDVPLTVRINPAGGATSGTCTFGPDGPALTVTWPG